MVSAATATKKSCLKQIIDETVIYISQTIQSQAHLLNVLSMF